MNILNFPHTQKLQLKVFKHHLSVSNDNKEYYQLAYESWKKVWQDVERQEMGITHSQFYSDDFTRQHHIISLFDNKKCIGLAFMREIDLKLECLREDTAFRFWPQEELSRLSDNNRELIIATSFTITSDYRRANIEWKTLFLSLFLDYFTELNQNLMITAARKVKSNEKLCYQLGGIPLLKDVPFRTKSGDTIKNEIADLLYWKKKQFSLTHKLLQSMREQIWASFSKEKNDEQILSA